MMTSSDTEKHRSMKSAAMAAFGREITILSLTFAAIPSWVFIIYFFFFNDTATTEIYTLSLHDALPIDRHPDLDVAHPQSSTRAVTPVRSEEHTSELQSRENLVCRLLLEKKKKKHP